MAGAGAVDWLPGLAFLLVGLALGVVLVWRFRSRSPLPPPSGGPVALRDLAGKRDALLAQLRELEDTAAKRNPAQLARERYALELAAAQAMMALEELESAAARGTAGRAGSEVAVGAQAPLSERPALRGFLWGTCSAAAVGLLLFFVAQAARPRAQAGSVTGGLPGASGAEGTSSDPEEVAARDAVARNPDDLDARLALTRIYLRHRNLMGVWNETQYVLTKSPGQPQALSYQSIVRLAMGQPEMALEMLKQALRTDPDLFEAYVHLSFVYSRLGRVSEAQATVAEAMRRFPEQAAALRRVEEEVRAEAANRTAQQANLEKSPHEGVPPPAGSGAASGDGGSPSRAADAGGEGRKVSGTLELDPSLAGQVAPGSVVFITLRESGFGAGPPLAAKRLVARSFPIPFEIGSADSMRGDPIPDLILVEARTDSDGDPLTRSPLDPAARADDVKAGVTNLHLVLKRR